MGCDGGRRDGVMRYARHWFSKRGGGERSPNCVRCGAPNPRKDPELVAGRQADQPTDSLQGKSIAKDLKGSGPAEGEPRPDEAVSGRQTEPTTDSMPSKGGATNEGGPSQ